MNSIVFSSKYERLEFLDSFLRLHNPFMTGNWSMGTLTNSVDPDEMLRYAASRQGLHCLPKHKQMKM